MAFVTIGIFAFTEIGIEGAIFQMISHGVVSAALFLCVGVVYDRMHTKEIKKYGGLVEKMPVYALLFMIFTMASVGLPGTSGFVGEILVLVGTYLSSKITAILAATGVILGATYMLWLYKRVVFGEITNPAIRTILDLNYREKCFLIPLAALTIFLGIYPSVIMNDLHATVTNLLQSGHFINVEMHEDAPDLNTEPEAPPANTTEE
jgi:NADH-quinone oxidoreductase subunit M